MLSKSKVEDEEEHIRSQAAQLPEQARQAFYSQFNAKVKDPDTFAVLAYSFGLSFHHFYLGKWVRALIELAITFIGFAIWLSSLFITLTETSFNDSMSPIALGYLPLIAIGLIELYSLFRAQIIVQDHNNRTMRQILSTLE